jgi:hypothetical protein
MGLRDTIQNNAGVGIAIAVVCILAAAWLVLGRGNAVTRGEWYYDLETGEVIAHDAQYAYPPLTLPNGHEGVELKRFACGDCQSGEVFDGYLYKVTQEWIDTKTADPGQGPIAPAGGELVAQVPGSGNAPQWFDQSTPRGEQIVNYPRDKCPGKDRPVMCLPR